MRASGGRLATGASFWASKTSRLGPRHIVGTVASIWASIGACPSLYGPVDACPSLYGRGPNPNLGGGAMVLGLYKALARSPF